MHQHPRPSPRSASAASNRQTNPERTNNQRIEQPPRRSRSSQDLMSYTERAGGDASTAQESSTAQEKEVTRLNQIIQHFHSKAALAIISSRVNLPQVLTKNGDIKQDRWFNTILDDTDVLIEDLHEWRRSDLSDDRPPPLVVEVFLDTALLTQNQALVAVDEHGKRWDVAEALAASQGSGVRPSKAGGRHVEVVLERWTIELGDASAHTPAELNDLLPNVYKKGVVLFRSLYSVTRLLPAWNFHRKQSRQPGGNSQALRLKFRITRAEGLASYRRKDALSAPLYPATGSNDDSTDAFDSGGDGGGAPGGQHASLHGVTRSYLFEHLLCPVGPLGITVVYRRCCDFLVSDAEALLSSRYLGLDEQVFQPSLASRAGRRDILRAGSGGETTQYGREITAYGVSAPLGGPPHSSVLAYQRGYREMGQAYGSMATFHQAEHTDISPVSALRKRGQEIADEADDEKTLPPPTGMPTSSLKSSLKSSDERPSDELHRLRRPSVTFNDGKSPFKAGSYSSSPRNNAASPASSLGTSKRASLNVLPQERLRTPSTSTSNDIAIASGPSSPKPQPANPRWSSSFANRRSRLSSGSKTGGGGGGCDTDDTTSSGRASTSSKEKAKASADSVAPPADDLDDIADFIASVNAASAQLLPRLSRVDNAAESRRLASTFQRLASLRDTSAQLSDSLASSVAGVHRSSAPHSPAVPSRLSTAASVARDGGGGGGGRPASEERALPAAEEEEEEEEEVLFPFAADSML